MGEVKERLYTKDFITNICRSLNPTARLVTFIGIIKEKEIPTENIHYGDMYFIEDDLINKKPSYLIISCKDGNFPYSEENWLKIDSVVPNMQVQEKENKRVFISYPCSMFITDHALADPTRHRLMVGIENGSILTGNNIKNFITNAAEIVKNTIGIEIHITNIEFVYDEFDELCNKSVDRYLRDRRDAIDKAEIVYFCKGWNIDPFCKAEYNYTLTKSKIIFKYPETSQKCE